jgi:hypothetical protein
MPYDVKIVFSGLCAYVPNKALGVAADPPTRMRLVMPDLRVARKVGVHQVARHLPVLAIDSGFLAGGAGAATGSKAVLPIARREISFAFQSAAGIALSIDQSGPGTDTDFNRGPAMADGAVQHATIDAACLAPQPPTEVAARVQIDAGHLAAHQPIRDPFYFRDDKQRLSEVKPRAHEISLHFRQVTDFEIRSCNLDDSASVATPWLRVVAAAGSTAELEIGNVCDGDLMLYWKLKAPEPESLDDVDFAAYYLLSANAATIHPEDFPPILTEQAGGGKTARCHDAIFEPIP